MLIVVAGSHGSTMTIAQQLGHRLRDRGHHVDVADTLTESTPSPSVYQAVIIGTDRALWRDRLAIGQYIAGHRDDLAGKATGLFVVNEARENATEAFSRSLGWRPNFAASLAVRNRQRVRAALRTMLVAVLGRLSGSSDVADPDDVIELADAISREVRRSRPAT